jgi:hypothetical protein
MIRQQVTLREGSKSGAGLAILHHHLIAHLRYTRHGSSRSSVCRMNELVAVFSNAG